METIFLFLTIVACCIAAVWPLSAWAFYAYKTPSWWPTQDRVAETLDCADPPKVYAFLLSVLWLLARVCA